MNALVETKSVEMLPLAAPQSDSLLILIERALSNPDIQVEKLNMLLDMRMKWDAEQERKAKEAAAERARKDFIAAMVEFKKLVPTILKDKHVEFNTSKGVTSYDHETIGAVCDAVIPALASVGITHSWPPKQTGKEIAVTCVLEHIGGHTREVTLTGGPEDSGTKNAIQAVGSAIKYWQRYTLLLVCGIASKHVHDDDARSTGGEPAAALKRAEAVVVPEGYQQWSDNLRAVCDEGRAKLLEVWKASDMKFRSHMTKHEAERWDGMKKLAEGVSKAVAEGTPS
jgi:hypothetical protein